VEIKHKPQLLADNLTIALRLPSNEIIMYDRMVDQAMLDNPSLMRFYIDDAVHRAASHLAINKPTSGVSKRV
jgi:hypothetical protein